MIDYLHQDHLHLPQLQLAQHHLELTQHHIHLTQDHPHLTEDHPHLAQGHPCLHQDHPHLHLSHQDCNLLLNPPQLLHIIDHHHLSSHTLPPTPVGSSRCKPCSHSPKSVPGGYLLPIKRDELYDILKDYVQHSQYLDLREEVQFLRAEVRELRKRVRKAAAGSREEEQSTAAPTSLHLQLQAAIANFTSSNLFDAVYKAMTTAFSDEEFLSYSVSRKPCNSTKLGQKVEPPFHHVKFGAVCKVLFEKFPDLERDRKALMSKIHAVPKRVSRDLSKKQK